MTDELSDGPDRPFGDGLTLGELRDLPDDDPRKQEAFDDIDDAVTRVLDAMPEEGDPDE